MESDSKRQHSLAWDPIYLPTPLHEQDVIQGQILYAGFTWFVFRVFLFLDRWPYQGQRSQFALLFTHSCRENNWIDNFPKGINSIWNANSFVQGLNSSRRVHVLQH